MRRATTRILGVGLALFALQSSADDWMDWSADNICSVSTAVRDDRDTVQVWLTWFRGSNTAPGVFLMQPTWAFARGGDLELRSPSLAEPQRLQGVDPPGAQGWALDALMDDVAAGRDWYLVRRGPDGSERRMNPDLSEGRRLSAMFGACRNIAERVPNPQPVAGQTRPRTFRASEFPDRCELSARYRSHGLDLLLTLDRGAKATSLKTSYANGPPRLDLRSLGGRSEAVVPWDAPATLEGGAADRLIGDLVAGRETLIPIRFEAGDADVLVFGGPEFIVEAAMFKACVDTL